MQKIKLYWLYLSLFFFISAYYAEAYANSIDQRVSVWPKIEINGDMPWDQNILYNFFVELRHNLTDAQYDNTRLQGGLGYALTPKLSLWGGYYWITLENPTQLELRIWQQALYQVYENSNVHFQTRTRFEQRQLLNQSQWSDWVRQRFTLSFPKKLQGRYTPVIWEEIFFNMNQANWTSNSSTIDQNRVFIGMNIPTGRYAYLQVGYIDRYLFRNPNNIDDHIFSITLYFTPKTS